MLIDFYAPTVITVAKDKIITDLNVVKPDNGLRIPSRRTEQKTKVEIDDIFVVVQYLDENGLYDKLPAWKISSSVCRIVMMQYWTPLTPLTTGALLLLKRNLLN